MKNKKNRKICDKWRFIFYVPVSLKNNWVMYPVFYPNDPHCESHNHLRDLKRSSVSDVRLCLCLCQDLSSSVAERFPCDLIRWKFADLMHPFNWFAITNIPYTKDKDDGGGDNLKWNFKLKTFLITRCVAFLVMVLLSRDRYNKIRQHAENHS